MLLTVIAGALSRRVVEIREAEDSPQAADDLLPLPGIFSDRLIDRRKRVVDLFGANSGRAGFRVPTRVTTL